MNRQLPGWIVLLIVTLIAGVALGATFSLTKDSIDEQVEVAANSARQKALSRAQTFEKLTLDAQTPLDWCYAGLSDGEIVGYVAQITVNGFGGEIEVIAGVDRQLAVTGISVGGSGFSETAGLGAKAKDDAFTGQFAGKIAPLAVVKAGGTRTEATVDAITSATITSTAVCNGVNEIVSRIGAFAPGADE